MHKLTVNSLVTSHKIVIKDISHILQLQLCLKDTILRQITCLQCDVSQIQLTTIIRKASTHSLSSTVLIFELRKRANGTETTVRYASKEKTKLGDIR